MDDPTQKNTGFCKKSPLKKNPLFTFLLKIYHKVKNKVSSTLVQLTVIFFINQTK